MSHRHTAPASASGGPLHARATAQALFVGPPARIRRDISVFFLEEAWQMAAQAALTSTTIRRPSLLAASLAVPGDLRLNVSSTGNSTQQQGTHEMRPGAPNFKTIGLEVNQAQASFDGLKRDLP